MPGCGSSSCNCAINVGPGLQKSGAGSLDDPFLIELSGELADSLVVEDTPTINLTLTGNGTPTDQYRISAQMTGKVSDLADVIDPLGTPDAGDTIIWVTTSGEPHFEFRPPPANPAGSVNVTGGITGAGTAPDPIKLALLGTSAGGATSGLEIYLDSAGKLRAVPPAGSSVAWTSVTGKPTTFPTTPTDFTGILTVAKGGTGAGDLAAITVGNATKVDGHRIFVQSSTPSGAVAGDLWFW